MKVHYLIIIASLILPNPALAKDCETALNICSNYANALQAELKTCKQLGGLYLNQRDRCIKEMENAVQEESILPTWGYFILGAAVGGLSVYIFRK